MSDPQSWIREESGTIGDLSYEIKTIQVSPADAWYNVGPLNDWLATGTAGDPTLGGAYCKHYDGTVEVFGAFKNGVLGTPCMRLPAELAPEYLRYFGCESNGAAGCLRVDTSGNVIPIGPSNVSFHFCFRFMPFLPYQPRLRVDSEKISTKLKQILGVLVLKSMRSSKDSNRPSSSPYSPEWRVAQGTDGMNLRLLAVPGLEFNQTHFVDVMIIGRK